jgi:hypothetical protein
MTVHLPEVLKEEPVRQIRLKAGLILVANPRPYARILASRTDFLSGAAAAEIGARGRNP